MQQSLRRHPRSIQQTPRMHVECSQGSQETAGSFGHKKTLISQLKYTSFPDILIFLNVFGSRLTRHYKLAKHMGGKNNVLPHPFSPLPRPFGGRTLLTCARSDQHKCMQTNFETKKAANKCRPENWKTSHLRQ